MNNEPALFIEILTGVMITEYGITDEKFHSDDRYGLLLRITCPEIQSVFLKPMSEIDRFQLCSNGVLMVYISEHPENQGWYDQISEWVKFSDLETFFKEVDEEVYQEVSVPENICVLPIVSFYPEESSGVVLN